MNRITFTIPGARHCHGYCFSDTLSIYAGILKTGLYNEVAAKGEPEQGFQGDGHRVVLSSRPMGKFSSSRNSKPSSAGGARFQMKV